jgi:hypothetical protein
MPMLPAQIFSRFVTLLPIPKETPVNMLTAFNYLDLSQIISSAIFSLYLRKCLCFEPLPEVPAYAPLWHPGCIT